MECGATDFAAYYGRRTKGQGRVGSSAPICTPPRGERVLTANHCRQRSACSLKVRVPMKKALDKIGGVANDSKRGDDPNPQAQGATPATARRSFSIGRFTYKSAPPLPTSPGRANGVSAMFFRIIRGARGPSLDSRHSSRSKTSCRTCNHCSDLNSCA